MYVMYFVPKQWVLVCIENIETLDSIDVFIRIPDINYVH